jgi:hypothetical protein
MGHFTILLQLIVALGLLNVWLVRLNKKTPYRGCDAGTLKDEFAAYGLPLWFFYLVGVLKVDSALFLLIGIWIPEVVFPTSVLVVFLMIGALAMHIKSKDPFIKWIPASLMLLCSLGLCLSAIT